MLLPMSSLSASGLHRNFAATGGRAGIYACGTRHKTSGFSRSGNTVQARRAKALRASVSRRACTIKKRHPAKRRVSVCSLPGCHLFRRCRSAAGPRAAGRSAWIIAIREMRADPFLSNLTNSFDRRSSSFRFYPNCLEATVFRAVREL